MLKKQSPLALSAYDRSDNSNRLGQVILLAMEEILGQSGAQAILELAQLPENPSPQGDQKFSFAQINCLQNAFESAYGQQAGRGVAMQIGRACLRLGLRFFAPELGLSDQFFRLLPLQAKVRAVNEAFAVLFNKYSDQQVRLDQDRKFISWQIEGCPFCWERNSDAPCCPLAIGMLQEAMSWASGGKIFEVVEKHCLACGDEVCNILIDRNPVG